MQESNNNLEREAILRDEEEQIGQDAGGQETQCPFECAYSDDRKWVNKASMVVFHIRDLTDLPPPNHSRLNVFFLIESAAHSGNVYRNLPPNYFNMTVTYRADSDVYWPNDAFEMIIPDQTPPENIWQEQEILEKVVKKTKLVLQLVSNCQTHSAREIYTSELKKYVSLTEYGSCSGNECPGDGCLYEKIDEHMFYLAFENSICKHYVTEKFWYMKRLIVPIVLSRKPFKGLGIPESTFISAEDFDSPQQLSQHLIFLQKNPAQYMKYFEWTKYYKSGERLIHYVNCVNGQWRKENNK
uniref:Fucosyltransferase n=1 Tax=Ditylenchus dipsaci TaxID=166011 RepID=A0A915D595_9BILA